MKTVFHLVRWDLRRFRVLLAVWLGLVAVRAVLDGLWPALAVDVESRTTVGIISSLLALAEALLSMMLVAVIVQEHRLVGTSAFWLTRPIPPSRLLGAKLALMGAALIAVPVIAQIVLMAAYSIPALQIAGVAAQTALFWALWLGIVMTLAALTPNVAKFALAAGGVLIAIAISLAVMFALLINREDDSPPLEGTTGMYDPTSDMVGNVLVILSIVILLFIQYRTRSRTRSVAIGVACIAITVVVSGAWRWPVLAPEVDMPAWAADPSMLRLSAPADTVHIDRTVLDFNDRPSDWRLTRARVWLSGIAPGWSADGSVRDASIRTGTGAALTSRVPGQRAGIAIDDVEEVPNREVIRRLLDVEQIDDGSSATKAGSIVVHYARYPDLQRIAPATGVYDGKFEVRLTRHVVEAVLPLRVGTAHVNGSYQFSIARIQPREGRVSMVAHESSAQSVFERRPLSRMSFYLRNRPLSEAMAGSQYNVRNDVALATIIPLGMGFYEAENSGFGARALTVQFPPMYGEKVSIALDDRWLAQAELVIVRSTESGAVERSLAIADFPIRAE